MAAMTNSLDAARAALETHGFTVHMDETGIRPQLVSHHPDKGIVTLEEANGDVAKSMIALNRRVDVLREEIPAIRRVPIERRIIDLHAVVSTRKELTVRDVADGQWVTGLPRRPIESQVQADLVAAYQPAVEISLPARVTMRDHGSKRREAYRLRLDAEQGCAVANDSDEVIVVTGPPGSGKTLVIAARAKRLALAHPDWEIQVLCFNNMLVPYLRSLVGPFPNIDVTTFGKFVSGLGYRVALRDDENAAADVARALPLLRSNPPIDALLIDEAQDFLPPWIDFALASVKPNRGGAALAGDPNQSLYRRASVMEEAIGSSVKRIRLERPYRSTRPILDVANALSPSSGAEPPDRAFDGEPVDLVWADSSAEQAAAVARDICDLVRSGERKPQNIGVLVTRKWLMGKVSYALEERNVPTRRLYANEAAELDLTEPTVKIMTVHSAKGIDFDVVFLVGLEDLPDDESDDSIVQGRVGYVGMTRAKDQLVITYSKDNAYLERIRNLPEDTLRRWVWPDDFPEV